MVPPVPHVMGATWGHVLLGIALGVLALHSGAVLQARPDLASMEQAWDTRRQDPGRPDMQPLNAVPGSWVAATVACCCLKVHIPIPGMQHAAQVVLGLR